MLRNPAYLGRAAYQKTGRVDGPPTLNRVARRQGRAVSRHARTRPRPIEDRIEIAVPAIIDEDTRSSSRPAEPHRDHNGPAPPSWTRPRFGVPENPVFTMRRR